MRTLVTMHPLPLLLLLLLLLHSLQAQKLLGNINGFYVPTDRKEFAEYLEEVYGTGPTRKPSREKALRKVIAERGTSFSSMYCRDEMWYRNVHYRLRCVPENFFLYMEYEELQEICKTKTVPCKDGTKRCKKSNRIIQAVYCSLIEGERMPDCEYASFQRRGYVLITCRWQNETQEFIPDSINDMIPD
ncbi:inactive ribonuclease-like protein 9 [Carlito syrichta]|uniref:Inactive ribonuclease-like protein 9 n=1 Tax=Carlito syrichta TaxID=1868482 RepID=A0A1U7UB02_CARSF|nr:inactive ribonuclease-like protein 9 [Carlito syrichta]